jgi:hypothetical protein
MPYGDPLTVYPLAVNLFVTMFQILLVMYGPRFSYTQRLISGFLICGIIMLAIPFACKLPNPTNFWVVFAILLIFGAFSGIV